MARSRNGGTGLYQASSSRLVSISQKTLNNWNSEKVYLVICGRLLVVCGRLWLLPVLVTSFKIYHNFDG